MYAVANVALIVQFFKLRRGGIKKNPLLWVVTPVIGLIVLAIPIWGDLRPGQDAPYNAVPRLTVGLVALGVLYTVVLSIVRPNALAHPRLCSKAPMPSRENHCVTYCPIRGPDLRPNGSKHHAVSGNNRVITGGPMSCHRAPGCTLPRISDASSRRVIIFIRYLQSGGWVTQVDPGADAAVLVSNSDRVWSAVIDEIALLTRNSAPDGETR